MKQLFVSYAREDLDRVAPLVELLRRSGFDVFWDQSLGIGVKWRSFLAANLSSAHCLLVLWSRDSVVSDWVAEEADEALRLDKLAPVLLDAVRPPLGFRGIHCFDLTDWQGDADDSRLQRLAEQLHARTGGGAAPAPVPPTPRPRSWRWLLVGAAAAGGLGLAVFFSNTGDGTRPTASGPAGPAASAASAASGAGVAAAASAAKPPPHTDADALARRCAAINEQRQLGMPISAADRAFLQNGCR